jgi:hypothetical protein
MGFDQLESLTGIETRPLLFTSRWFTSFDQLESLTGIETVEPPQPSKAGGSVLDLWIGLNRETKFIAVHE